MKGIRNSWVDILKSAGVYIKLRQKLQFSHTELSDVVRLIPLRINRYESAQPNIPLCLSVDERDSFLIAIPETRVSHLKGRRLLQRIFKQSVQVFGELSNPFDLNESDDD